MTNKLITIKDVAREAKVGVSTASRALGGYGYVSEETRKKIQEVAKKIGYQYNLVAKGLRTSKTLTIGYVMPNIANPFFTKIARGIQDIAFELGYNVILCNNDNDTIKTERLFKMFFSNRVEGIIFSTPYNQSLEKMTEIAKNIGIPVVNCYGSTRVYSSDCIIGNSEIGCYKAMKHLIELGHRAISILKVRNSGISRKRFQGCLKALDEYGIDKEPELILDVDDFSIINGYLAAKILMSQARKPTAILALNEQLALGILQTIREESISIPDDLSLVSVDDVLAPYLNPPLTSVSIPTYELGKGAASLLINRIENENKIKYRRIELDEELVVRATTGGIINNIQKRR